MTKDKKTVRVHPTIPKEVKECLSLNGDGSGQKAIVEKYFDLNFGDRELLYQQRENDFALAILENDIKQLRKITEEKEKEFSIRIQKKKQINMKIKSQNSEKMISSENIDEAIREIVSKVKENENNRKWRDPRISVYEAIKICNKHEVNPEFVAKALKKRENDIKNYVLFDGKRY